MVRRVLGLALAAMLMFSGCRFPDGHVYVALPAEQAAGLYRDGAYEMCVKLAMGVMAQFGLRQYGPNLMDVRVYCTDQSSELQQRRYYPYEVPREMPPIYPNTGVHGT